MIRLAYDYNVFLNPAGIGRFSTELLRHLCKIASQSELEIYLFYNSFISDIPKPYPEISERCCFIRTHFPLFIFKYAPLLRFQFCYKILYPALCSKYNIDIFHGMENLSISSPKAISISTVYDLFFFLEKNKTDDNQYHRIMRNKLTAFKNYDFIIAVSENTKKDLLKIPGVTAEKIRVIYPGVSGEFCLLERENKIDKKHLLAIKRKYSLPDQYLLYSGNFVRRKNLPRLVDIFFQYKKNKNNSIKLVLAGHGYGKDYKVVKKKISESGLEKDIFLIGHIGQELPYLYYMAECLIFLSLYEGFGLPVIEAMAAGAPVVAADNSSLKEISGGYAILVNPDNTSEVIHAIEKAIQIKENNREFILNAARYAKRFDWAKSAQELYTVYKDIYQQKKGCDG